MARLGVLVAGQHGHLDARAGEELVWPAVQADADRCGWYERISAQPSVCVELRQRRSYCITALLDLVLRDEAVKGGWFRSGDLGIVTEDGYLPVADYLPVAGRKKDMIKTGGENVANREVEEAIYELNGVAVVAVSGISHPYWVEAVTAVVVPKDGATLTAEDVLAPARLADGDAGARPLAFPGSTT